MVLSIADGEGIQALDQEQLLAWLRGDTIVSGCAPSAGGSALETDVASGTARVNGSNVSVSSQTVTHDSGGSNPRKDVVYIDSGGTAQIAKGTAAAAQPSGNTQFDTYEPAPPDLSSTDAAVVAEVWVAAGESGTFDGADVRDRRLLSAVDLDAVTVESLGVTNETYVEATLGTSITGISSGTWTNVADTEENDNRDEFNASQQFVPDETGQYIILGRVRFNPGVDQDGLRVRLRNVTDTTTVVEPSGASSSGTSNRNVVVVAFSTQLTAGKAYELQGMDNDSSFDIIGGGDDVTGYNIIRSVVNA